MPGAIQFKLFTDNISSDGIYSRLTRLLSQNLDYHDKASTYASHNFHSFPAKFPPQLPGTFISGLTQPGEVVLDPMMGSGTTILESFFAARRAVGFDIDPLALLISRVKVTPVNRQRLSGLADQVLANAQLAISLDKTRLEADLTQRFDVETKRFVDYWFAPETQIELLAIIEQINEVDEIDYRRFLLTTLSSIIITKSGGVSLALDLGHTRPHRVAVATSKTGARTTYSSTSNIVRENSKTIGSPISEFGKKVQKNLKSLCIESNDRYSPVLAFGNSQSLPLADSTVDLIVTSPPYASNAIDYMRAHKFSLVWLGHMIAELSEKRKEYIGGEATEGENLEDTLPKMTSEIISRMIEVEKKKGRVLHRYYSEMWRTLKEMYRVLKPGKVAVVVVGTSVMRGINTQTPLCLEEIGESIGFIIPNIGVRSLDRNRRMLPVGKEIDIGSQIQNRMHEEYVIGFLKPQTR